jgi:hypothetical protein
MKEPLAMQLARALDAVSLELHSLSYEAVLARLAEIEQAYLTKHAGNPRDMLEVQRRAAEQRVLAAVLKHVSYEECRQQFETCRALGFTDIGQEFTVLSSYTRFCSDKGLREEEKDLFEGFHTRLGDVIRQCESFRRAITERIVLVENADQRRRKDR